MAQQDGGDPNRPYIIIDGKPVYTDQLSQSQPGFGIPSNTQQRRRQRGIGCWILGILLIGCLPIAIIAVVLYTVFGAVNGAMGQIPNLGEFSNIISTAASLTTGPESQPVKGDPAHFDPIASLNDARTFAGSGSQLVSLVASYVRSDGTMDLTATYTPGPNTEYKFVREVPRPTNAPPVGAGGTKNGKWYEAVTINVYQPGQTSYVRSFGGNVSTSYSYTNEGMEKDVDDPTTNPDGPVLPDPKCSFVDLWKQAIKKDAPKDAVAVITYSENGYDFNITGTMDMQFDTNCKPIS